MRVLLADDEPLAREGLKLLLAAEPDIEIVAECADGIEAVEAILAHRPALVFLDINMPGMSGLEVVAAVGPDRMPPVIFLTAYDQFAIDAFRLSALDYLLKPVDDGRFRDSLRRARADLAGRAGAERAGQLTQLISRLLARSGDERIMIRTPGHVYFLKPADIRWIEAEGDYVSIHTAGRTHLVRETLRHMEERLQAQGFQRVHRSSLVNLDAIGELVTNANGDCEVLLLDGTKLRLSRQYRDELCARLQASVQHEYR